MKKAPKSAAMLSVLREIYHAVVLSVYRQWVLLDKDWAAAHVERAQRALRNAGVDQPMATVVSKRAGIERLID